MEKTYNLDKGLKITSKKDKVVVNVIRIKATKDRQNTNRQFFKIIENLFVSFYKQNIQKIFI